MWTFGALEPGCFGVLEVATGKSVLFVPHQPPEYAVWMGPLLTLQDFKNKYCVDEVLYTNEVCNILNTTNLVVYQQINHNVNLQTKANNYLD